MRDYQMGDDIRTIDWKCSARLQKLIVRRSYDEQTRHVIIAVDRSASMRLAYNQVVHEVAACIAAAALGARDALTALCFTDTVTPLFVKQRGTAVLKNFIEQLTEEPDTKQPAHTSFIN